MAVCKCKMCGGSFDFDEGEVSVKCEYCGSEMILVDEKTYSEIQRENIERAREERLTEKESEATYCEAVRYMNKGDNVLSLRAAVKYFYMIPDYKDSKELAQQCEEKLRALESKGTDKNYEKQHRRNTLILAIGLLLLICAGVWACMKAFGV